MFRRSNRLALCFGIAAATALVVPDAQSKPPQQAAEGVASVHAPDRKSGFGRPESIAGTIALVKPQEGLLVVVQRGPGQPPSTVVSGATTVTQNQDGTTTTTDTDVSARPGPGETDYHFRLTGSTLIRINGASATLNELVGLQDRPATVHFVPERNGNFAKEIDVSR